MVSKPSANVVDLNLRQLQQVLAFPKREVFDTWFMVFQIREEGKSKVLWRKYKSASLQFSRYGTWNTDKTHISVSTFHYFFISSHTIAVFVLHSHWIMWETMRAALVSLQMRWPQARSCLICRANRYLEKEKQREQWRRVGGRKRQEAPRLRG